MWKVPWQWYLGERIRILGPLTHVYSEVTVWVHFRIRLPMQEMQERRFHPWVGKVPWSRKWQPTPVFLPGKFCGWRSLSMGPERVGHD